MKKQDGRQAEVWNTCTPNFLFFSPPLQMTLTSGGGEVPAFLSYWFNFTMDYIELHNYKLKVRNN